MGQPTAARLSRCDDPLCVRYDTGIFDLDGVVYVGGNAVPDAPDRIAAVRQAGMHVAFVTNNASRAPGAVAARLRQMGVELDDRDVVTSAQAAARLLAELLPRGSTVLVVGGPGLVEAVTEQGLRPVDRLDNGIAGVVQGFGPDVGWRDLAEAVAAVDAGLPWVASNLDATFPTPRGRAPGNGQLVEVVARTTGRRPARVAGKPERALFDETLTRFGGSRPLVVGDRLDTDIEGAVRSELDSLLVMTGVTGAAELCAAPVGQRPSYVSLDLQGLLVSHPGVGFDDGVARCGGWSVRVVQGRPVIEGGGDEGDALRTLAVAGWAYADRIGDAVNRDAITAAWEDITSAPGVTVDHDQTEHNGRQAERDRDQIEQEGLR
jgi:glycerol-1-phosphatase